MSTPLITPYNAAPLHKLLIGLAAFGIASIGVTIWNVVDFRKQCREWAQP